mgnify:CR=1 FL=1
MCGEFYKVPKGETRIDYAHHPDEIRATLAAAKAVCPGKVYCIFQPHTYSRFTALMPGFAEALSLADEVILIPIYPARELPIPGVESEMILPLISGAKKEVVARENLIDTIKNRNFEILLTAGAGDIADLVPGIARACGAPV